MAKTKRARWVCPLCGDGVLASTRPRKNATVRYCLKCSDRTGKLVERTCPALDKKRAAKSDNRKAKAQRKRERTEAKANAWPHVLHKVFADLKKLKAWDGDVKHAELNLRYSTERKGAPGHAKIWSGVVTVTAGSDVGSAIETLVHELAHVCCYTRFDDYDKHHGERFRSVLMEASRELIGAERVANLGLKSTYRYELDNLLEPRYSQAITDGVLFGKYNLEPHYAPKVVKKRLPEPVIGNVRFSISDRFFVLMNMDASDTWRDEYPELAFAYDNGARKGGKTPTTTVEGAIRIARQMRTIISDHLQSDYRDYQTVERLDNKLGGAIFTYDQLVGYVVGSLFATIGGKQPVQLCLGKKTYTMESLRKALRATESV